MQQSPSNMATTAVAIAMTSPVKILDENLTFQDSLHEFLSENSDFLVVGCVGLQWSGKSTVLSHLATSKYKL
jgi:protein SMG9